VGGDIGSDDVIEVVMIMTLTKGGGSESHDVKSLESPRGSPL